VKNRLQTKDVPSADLLLAIAEDHRASVRREYGERWYTRLPFPERLLIAKAGRLCDRGVLEYGTSIRSPWILAPSKWSVGEKEREEWAGALTAAGHTFGDYMLEDRPEDVAVGEAHDREAAAERERLRTCKPTNIADYIGKRAVLAMDEMGDRMERFLLTGKA
jgi:hypothetical protein